MLWHDIGVSKWGDIKEDRIVRSFEKKLPSYRDVEDYKQKKRTQLEQIKFNHALEKIRLNHSLTQEDKTIIGGAQSVYWEDKVKKDIEAAIENPDNAVKHISGLEGQYKLNIPQAEMDRFKYKAGTGKYKIEKAPDFISYNPVDETLNAVFLTTDESGNQTVDQKKTRKMTPDKYGDQIKLYYIGKSGFSKVQPKKVDQTPSSGIYKIKGKQYSEQELLKMGYTLEQIKPYEPIS